MSRKFIALVAGGLVLTFAAAPLGVLHSQVTAPGTNPRGVDTSKTTTTGANPTTTATPPPTTNAAAVRAEINTDLPFLQTAASANLMEIQLGQLAQTKGSNNAVKQFGKRMVTDHTRLEQQVSSLTSRNGVSLNPSLNSEAQSNVSQLQNLSGDQFDKAYMSMMIQGHQKDVIDFQSQSQSANSSQVRQLASNSLPILRQHLTLAQQVGSQVGATTTTNVVTANNANASNANAANVNTKASREIRMDRDFITVNAANNYMEVLLGRLALQKAQNSDVKAYAERVVRDHNMLQDEWLKVARQNGIPLKPGMGKNHREKLTRLEKLSGKEFDKQFMNTMIDTHQDYANSMEKQSRTAHSPEVRQIAERSLPTLRDSFHEAKRVGAEVGANNTNAKLRSES
ncbi:MAG TPA: DUF4142 domain-containing protein [Gemmatimonadales bacterium]|nr:DUF4142 domain-containing protein [Gemmatimonadales bacterium]